MPEVVPNTPQDNTQSNEPNNDSHNLPQDQSLNGSQNMPQNVPQQPAQNNTENNNTVSKNGLHDGTNNQNPEEFQKEAFENGQKTQEMANPSNKTNQPAGSSVGTLPPPPKSNRGLIACIILLVILVIIVVGGVFAYKKYFPKFVSSIKSKVQQLVPAEDENKQSIENIKRKSEIAKKEATKKYSDAYLARVNVGDNYVFLFISPKKNKIVSVTVELNKDKITKTLPESMNQSLKSLSTINMKDLKIGNKRALEIFDQNGGSDFKKKYSNFSQTNPSLTITKDKPLNWTIKYSAKKGNQTKQLLMYINAQNGSIIKKFSK